MSESLLRVIFWFDSNTRFAVYPPTKHVKRVMSEQLLQMTRNPEMLVRIQSEVG